MNRLSNRLMSIAAQVKPGKVLADIGCDHGYLPILLVKNGCMSRALAMDINEGPLLRAKEHIGQEALGDYIQTRQSNGMEKLAVGEADAVIIAGMGGNLTIDILTRGKAVAECLEQLILEPQSELAAVRKYLREVNYCVAAEDLVLEDGKFYPIIRVLPKQESDAEVFAKESGLDMEVIDAYGQHLLAMRHPILQMYLEKESQQWQQILQGLAQNGTDEERIRARCEELSEKLEYNQAAQAYMRDERNCSV